MLIYGWLEMGNSSSHLPAFFPLTMKFHSDHQTSVGQASPAENPGREHTRGRGFYFAERKVFLPQHK